MGPGVGFPGKGPHRIRSALPGLYFEGAGFAAGEMGADPIHPTGRFTLGELSQFLHAGMGLEEIPAAGAEAGGDLLPGPGQFPAFRAFPDMGFESPQAFPLEPGSRVGGDLLLPFPVIGQGKFLIPLLYSPLEDSGSR